jgi:hypothetical protein
MENWVTESINDWHYNPSVGGLSTGKLLLGVGGSGFTPLSISPYKAAHINYVTNSKVSFKAGVTYQFETTVKNYSDLNFTGFSLKIGDFQTDAQNYSYWPSNIKRIDYWLYNDTGASFYTPVYMTPLFGVVGDEYTLQFFSSPKSDLTTRYVASYQANGNFGSPNGTTNANASYLKKLEVKECNFEVQGYAIQKEPVVGVMGWVHNSGTYSWFIHSTASLTPATTRHGIGWYRHDDKDFSDYGEYVTSDENFTINNFIGKKIKNEELFNISFTMIFSTQSGAANMKMYLGNSLPTTTAYSYGSPLHMNGSPINTNDGLLIATFTQSDNYSFYNLNGGQYLYFMGSTSSASVEIKIGNFSITSGYSEVDNNELFSFTNTNNYQEPTPLSIIGASTYSSYESISITDQTIHETNSGYAGSIQKTSTQLPVFSTAYYSNVVGTVSNLSQLYSKVGNGTFRSGVWENGVWNSGWRVDENVHDFDNISQAINLTTANKRWRIQIDGSTFSTANFEIGDKVSIGNIVSININDKRKLLKGYFTIVNKPVNSDGDYKTLIVEVDNNFPIRRIEKDSVNHKISITKNVWLNGAFLNGYFQGVWNDGLFKGYPLITEMFNSQWIDGKFDGGHFYATKPTFKFVDTYYTDGFVGLTGVASHGLFPGDLIKIDKNNKSLNPNYDGDWLVTKTPYDNFIVTNIPWGVNTTMEGGLVTRKTSSGLVQNFNFYDRNISKKTSKNTDILKDIWRFESWMELNYSTQSTTNINSDRIYSNPSTTNFKQWRDKQKLGIGDYARLNLYGYMTEDVLSSESHFRGLDSLTKKAYSLGTKYEVYQDFLGDISNFNSPFDTNPEVGNLNNFFADGWTWSFSGIAGGTYSYLNTLNRKGSSNLLINTSSINTPPTWAPVVFQTLVEDTFGTFISYTTSEVVVNTTGVFDININMSSSEFSTTVKRMPITTTTKQIYLNDGEKVAQMRLMRMSATNSVTGIGNTWEILTTKDIRTSGATDFNVGVVKELPSINTSTFTKSIDLFLDWKGNLKQGDKIKLEFQKCSSLSSGIGNAGPWKQTGWLATSATSSSPGMPINLISMTASWNLKSSRSMIVSNSGMNNDNGFNFKRTSDGTLLLEHTENSYHSFTLNNKNIDIPKNRYSMIEFDLLQSPDTVYQTGNESYNFHWTDLYNFTNFINADQSYSSNNAFPGVIELSETIIGTGSSATYYNPKSKSVFWNGVDYTKTLNTKKVEYFYNRPGLDLGLISEQLDTFRNQVHELDNIKFYEVDMIPFFQYTTEDYVDKSIKVPFQGKAPFIDYANSDFSFTENIVMSLDSVQLQVTNSTFTGGTITPFIYAPVPSISIYKTE